ncbi:MAG TPA: PQQ-binding-like beta-propeller repeat protein [Gaiellaceae bacterium]|nr:PQQ-binding-like beta-propeller repeat protein [Gaiellaceae bacterium]
MKRLAVLPLLLAGVLVAAALGRPSAPAGLDWNRFGYDAARHNAAPGSGITAANVAKLVRLQVKLDGTVDSSPIYLHGVAVRGATHDVFFVTTTYGKTEAIDAASGKVLWRFTPPSYGRLAGSAQITNSTPAAATDRSAVYAAAPDGRVRKLRVADGKVLWTTTVTRDPTREKMTSSINVSHGLVIMTTGGYIGDAPSYQGHVVTLSERNGRIIHAWNSLCSDRQGIILPASCRTSDSAIWSRNGAAVDPANGNLVVATGNAPYDGHTNWGDSVLVLSPDAARLLRHYTPANHQQLNDNDVDLGSTSPALLPDGYAVQGGKDGILRLLQLHRLPGVNPTTGGELQTLPAPGPTDVFSEPAVWNGRWVFVATSAGTEALLFKSGRLHPVWSNHTDGTSPVIAGSLLYVAGSGVVHVYVPTSGREVAQLRTGSVHWQSPIVVDGRVAMPEGNANDHATSGVLDIYRLP